MTTNNTTVIQRWEAEHKLINPLADQLATDHAAMLDAVHVAVCRFAEVISPDGLSFESGEAQTASDDEAATGEVAMYGVNIKFDLRENIPLQVAEGLEQAAKMMQQAAKRCRKLAAE